MSNSRRSIAFCGLIVLLVVLAYTPVIFQGGFIWDDDHYVQDNKLIKSNDGLARILFSPRASPQYYPIVFTTFSIEYRLWGLKPAGYHVVNILLHATNAVLLWLVLRKLKIPAAALI